MRRWPSGQGRNARQHQLAVENRDAIAPIARENELIERRDEIIRQRDEAIREREQLQQQLQAVQLREIQLPQRWIELEEERNALLAPIRGAYDRAIGERGEDNITVLERAIETILPKLQQGKELFIQQLNRAIEQLPPDNPARQPLQDLLLIHTKEGQSLQIFGRLLAAPIQIRRN